MAQTPARPWRRTVPSATSAFAVPIAVHGAMVATMVLIMVSGAPAAPLVAALLLVTLSATLGVAARTTGWAREAILDLWAMAFMLLTPMTAHQTGGPLTGGHHAAAVSPGPGAILVSQMGIVMLWSVGRLWIGRRSSSPRHSLLTALLCAVQLAIML